MSYIPFRNSKQPVNNAGFPDKEDQNCRRNIQLQPVIRHFTGASGT